MDRAAVEAKVTELRQRRDQVIQALHELNGALVVLEDLLNADGANPDQLHRAADPQ